MTLQGALPVENGSRSVRNDPIDGHPHHTHPATRRGRPAVAWTVVATVIALITVWQIAGQNPKLSPSGVGYVDAAFVQYQDSFPTRYAAWVVWDEPRGAQVALVLRNERPWPVTVAAMDSNTITTTRFAPLTSDDFDTRELSDYSFSDRITVPANGRLVLAVRISAGCVPMSAGTTSGASSIAIATTSLGVEGTATVELETSFVAGFTAEHVPGPECAG